MNLGWEFGETKTNTELDSVHCPKCYATLTVIGGVGESLLYRHEDSQVQCLNDGKVFLEKLEELKKET